jgi:hypothetical protein
MTAADLAAPSMPHPEWLLWCLLTPGVLLIDIVLFRGD